jgi:hypothetical protein
MHQNEIMDLARPRVTPAVSVLVPVEQPVPTHPETALRLRALVDEAVRTTATAVSAEAARRVRAQFDAAAVTIDPAESARGLALFVSPDDHLVLRLPFRVEEEVIVDSTFATRQLFEGFARRLRSRVVVLEGDGARLFEGDGEHLVETQLHSFPVRVERPTEQDTPHHDRPRHESVREEDRRVVERAVAAALAVAHAADPRPLVVVGEERRVATLREVADLGADLAGVVHGDHAGVRSARLAELVGPRLDAWQTDRRVQSCSRLRDAVGRKQAVATLPEVLAAVAEGRGRELIVEEGLAMPRTWLDGLSPGEEADPQIDTEDVVDDLIEAVLSSGGAVTFVDRGSLDDCGQVGLLLRW